MVIHIPAEHKILEKKSGVSKPPSGSCGTLNAVQSTITTVGSAHINDILGPISPSDRDGETADQDTTPVVTPKKKTAKKKKKTKKKEDKGKGRKSSESDNSRAKHMGDQLQEDQIKREGWIWALGNDFPIIQQIRAKMGLADNIVTQWDMMPILERINRYQ